MHRLAYNECISFSCADGTSADLYQLMLTLDRQFMAGMAYYVPSLAFVEQSDLERLQQVGKSRKVEEIH